MRLAKLQLIHFKRFDNLTIDLGVSPAKVVALVGPNGSGKSSVFDAFQELAANYKGTNRGRETDDYFNKRAFAADPAQKSTSYSRADSIVATPLGAATFGKASIYVRTAYRFTSALRVQSIQAQPNVLDDIERPRSTIDLDSRLQENYARLLGQFLEEAEQSDKSGKQIKADLVDAINKSLANVLAIRISSLGNVTQGKGQLFFEKDGSRDFPYELLSAGEKEVVDILLDLFVKAPHYADTIFAIDEPELHLNTSIQRRLLLEVVALIPDNCQLWIATHSIGFLRALQEDLKDSAQVIDFSDSALFADSHIVRPMVTTRANWQRLFATALEDLTGLLAPKRIIYCEGRPAPTPSGDEQGLDALVYNTIFDQSHNDTLFVSSGGGDAKANSSLALRIIGKAFASVSLFLLKDRDGLSAPDRAAFLAQAPSHRMLLRREVENYLYDKEVVAKAAAIAGQIFDEEGYDTLITDIAGQDLKLAPVPGTIQTLCGSTLSKERLKLQLAALITPDTSVYTALTNEIF